MDGICQILQCHISGFPVSSYLFSYITGKFTHIVSLNYPFFLFLDFSNNYIGEPGDL